MATGSTIRRGPIAAGLRQAKTQDIVAADLAHLLGIEPLAIALRIEDALGERAGLPPKMPYGRKACRSPRWCGGRVQRQFDVLADPHRPDSANRDEARMTEVQQEAGLTSERGRWRALKLG